MFKQTFTAMTVAAAFTLSHAAMAQALSKDDYKMGKDSIAAEYKSDKKKCESLAGNAKDICTAEAEGKEKTAKADLEARYKDTDKARYEAAITKAKADYEIAKQRCDDQAGDAKDACVKEAQAAEATAKADAKSSYSK